MKLSTRRRQERTFDNMRKQIRALVDQLELLGERLENLVKIATEEWGSGPESSREEFAPNLSGGDRPIMRLAAA